MGSGCRRESLFFLSPAVVSYYTHFSHYVPEHFSRGELRHRQLMRSQCITRIICIFGLLVAHGISRHLAAGSDSTVLNTFLKLSAY